jgi:two-component system, OmpR family, alkaline phosphatase synthesis response regulator PhoP
LLYPTAERCDGAYRTMIQPMIHPLSPRQILIIDDEEPIQMVVQFGLKMAAGWSVLCASSGLAGIAIAENESLDVILLDIMMPEMDGVSTFHALQANPKTGGIPVIFLTAKAQTAEKRQFQELGASGLITKPFNALDLPMQINKILHWSATA